jgi:hypothetical protein
MTLLEGRRQSREGDTLDVGRDDDGTPFIVQELLEGKDLARHVLPKRLDFGISQVLAAPDSVRMTATGVAMGTPA